MSPEGILVALLLAVAVAALLSELRDARTDLATERGERLRLQGEKADWLRATRLGQREAHAARLLEAQPAAKALAAGPEKPKQPLRELEPGAFSDTPVIERPYDSAHTVEHPLPTLPTPAAGQRFPTPDPTRGLIDPTQVPERMRQFLKELPGWPGTQKENAHVT